MKVILLQGVRGLGKIFDIKNVADGYARNFLIPKKLARVADEKSIKELELKREIWRKKEEELKMRLESMAKELNSQDFNLTLKTGKIKEVFGSITREDIKRLVDAKIAGLSIEKDKIEVYLDKPIKTLGDHEVEINLSRGVRTKIKLRVLAQQ